MSTPEPSNVFAPGYTAPGPFSKAQAGVPIVTGSQAPTAWKVFTDALGKEFQGGLYRAHLAQRRLGRRPAWLRPGR